MVQLATHNIYAGGPLPPVSLSVLYEYWLAGNGLYLRARRLGLEVLMPLCSYPVRGLADLQPYLWLDYEPVSQELVARMLGLSRQARDIWGQPVEKLFHLSYAEGEPGGWQLAIPPQAATGGSVKPLLDGSGSSYERAIFEVHSHHSMRAFFSPTDDRDEARSFRLFGVMGRIFDRPEIRVRVGVFGHFWEVEAAAVLELPEELHDTADSNEEARRIEE